MNNHKVGIALGLFFALWHLAWAIVVALGFAKTLLDFVFTLHFLNNPFVVSAFSPVIAVGLVVVTGLIGYILGWVFAWSWNWSHKK